jgi:nitroreductase
MELREAVATRFSCSSYLDKPVSESVVRAILECAARAPSGGNL